LSPKILKHWYAGDGSLHREDRIIQIATTNEIDNKQKIEKMFRDSDLPEPNGWGETQMWWNKEESQKLLNYMGKPIKGFGYKW